MNYQSSNFGGEESWNENAENRNFPYILNDFFIVC